jgi:hypothetical protein
VNDLWWYVTGAPPGPTQTVAVVGAARNAMAGGPLVRRPGEVVPEMAAYLYHRPNINTPVALLDNALGHTFQDRLKDVGTGHVEMLNDDPDLSTVWDHECVVRFEIHGRAAFTMIVDDIEHVAIAEGEEHDERTGLNGRAHIAVLEEGLVYPAGGPDRKPWGETRLFSWPSIDFDDHTWAPVTLIAPDIHTMQAAYADMGTPNSAQDFPDLNAPVLWGTPGELFMAPDGMVYMRGVIDVPTSGNHIVYWLLDNWGELWLDGESISESYGDTTFEQALEVPVELSAGLHTFAVSCVNWETPDRNPGAFAMCLYSTDAQGNPLDWVGHADGTWVALSYPPTAPGMTPGEAARHAVDEAQARGAIPELRLGFTDEFDSDGNAWPVVGDIATAIGTNLSTFILDELASTYIDVWMGPGDWTLFAWVKGLRGENRDVALAPPVDEGNPGEGNLRGLVHHVIR